MKEKYSKPYTEIEEFKAVDILTASGDIQPGDTDVSFGD